MIKKINWFDVFLAFVTIAMFSLLAFANSRNSARYIEQVDIKLLSSDNHFITQEMVEKLIVQTFPRDSKIINSDLNLKKIEDQLNHHSMIANSEVF